MKPTQKVLGGRKEVKVAIVQTPPVFLDREKTIDRACQKITEAASQGAELIVFPEAWIAGYPYWSEGWSSTLQKWAPVRIRFYDNAIIIPSEDTDRLCAAAAKANSHVWSSAATRWTHARGFTPYTTPFFSLTDPARYSAGTVRLCRLSWNEPSGAVVTGRTWFASTPT